VEQHVSGTGTDTGPDVDATVDAVNAPAADPDLLGFVEDVATWF
jgi:hypothetical protein